MFKRISGKDRHGACRDRRTRKGSGFVVEPAFRCNELTLSRGADLHSNASGRGRAGRLKDLFSRHDHLDRASGLLGKHHRQRLQIDRRLSTETPTDFRGDHPDLSKIQSEQLRRIAPDHELALGAAPNRHLTTRLRIGETSVRFDITLMNGLSGEGSLNHDIRPLKSGLWITVSHLDMVSDIRKWFFLTLAVTKRLLNDGRAGGGRRSCVQNVWQDLVFNVDQLEGLFGQRGRRRRNRSNRVAHISDLASRENILRHHPVVSGALPEKSLLGGNLR